MRGVESGYVCFRLCLLFMSFINRVVIITDLNVNQDFSNGFTTGFEWKCVPRMSILGRISL